MVEHAERHLELLLAGDVAHERGERRVHGEDDVVGPEGRSELGSGVVVEPEAAAEADLAGPVALRGEGPCRLLEALGLGQAGRADPDLAHGGKH